MFTCPPPTNPCTPHTEPPPPLKKRNWHRKTNFILVFYRLYGILSTKYSNIHTNFDPDNLEELAIEMQHHPKVKHSKPSFLMAAWTRNILHLLQFKNQIINRKLSETAYFSEKDVNPPRGQTVAWFLVSCHTMYYTLHYHEIYSTYFQQFNVSTGDWKGRDPIRHVN